MHTPNPLVILSLLASHVTAHTFIWGVFVNGVRIALKEPWSTPPYNGPPGAGGYNNSPVKNLTSIDMRCNVLGDVQASDTIVVRPGDNLTFDWHHDKRSLDDDVIASSHHAPSLVYISPDPPTENSFVKIWHEGLFQDYLIRAEMIALHEGEVSYLKVPARGAQFYPNCVQIEVVDGGDVELPQGVSFPGAYDYDTPGIVYDVYCSTETPKTPRATPCTTRYPIPGPTVWSGAWADTTSVPRGPIEGPTTHTSWSTWIKTSTVTSASYTDKKSISVVGTSVYTPNWSATYQTPAPGTRRW